MTVERFPCTAGGAVLAGRQRLRLGLGGLALLMAAVALAAFIVGRWGAGGVAAAVALLPWIAWRMRGDLDPLALELSAEELTLKLRRGRASLPREGLAARALDADERAHLASLASVAGIVAGSGGFDSHRLGEFELFASDLAHAVLVEGEAGRWIVTPDDPQAFLVALARPLPNRLEEAPL